MTEFNITLERLVKVSDDMLSEMEAGLRGDDSSLLMLPTYIHRLPTRKESGDFLALGRFLKGFCSELIFKY